jgi:hydroxymethylbilane synthase
LPDGWADAPDTLVWAAGSRTWRRLAARGVWVHGCADGLGEDEPPPVDTLAGRPVRWVRLTHSGAERPGDLATYTVETTLPDDLPSRTHLFWTSGELFLQALDRWPELRGAWHASGPGRTRDVIRTTLGVSGRTGLWLDRESWERDICL